MSILLAATLAAASTVQPSCSWDRPGANPYTGQPDAAIDRYQDIPAAVRATLKRRILEGQPDDVVNITRDAISGKNRYDPTIRDMHFGAASVCHTVTRGKWALSRKESGAVYCVDQHCILVPKICGNVSRVSRLPAAAVAKGANRKSGGPGGGAPAGGSEMADGMNGQNPGSADAAPQSASGPTDQEIDDLNKLPASAAGPGTPPPVGGELGQASDNGDRGRLAGTYGRSGFGGGGGDPFAYPTFGSSPTAVPEADTWAMLLSGLGLMGFVGRRARKRAAPAK